MYEITCPSCQRLLRIPEGVKESSLTCPRCLTKVDNPMVGVRTDLPKPSSSPLAAVTGSATCPSCGRIVEKVWGYCPFCKVPLNGPYRVRRRRSVDEETRSDTIASATGLVLMSLLGAVGIIVFFCSGGPMEWDLDRPSSPSYKQTLQGAGVIGMIISAFLCITVIGGIILAAKSQVQGMRIGVIVIGALVIPLILFAAAVSFIVYSCAQ